METRELIEKINKIHAEFKEANDLAIQEREKFGQESILTREKVDKMVADLTAITKEIEEMRAKAEAPKREEKELDEKAQLLVRAWDKYLRYGFTSEQMTSEEKRSLSQASDADGGFLAPEMLESSIIIAASNIAVIRPLCDVGTTGNAVVVNGLLSKPIVAWGNEKLDISEQDLDAGVGRNEVKDLKALYLVSNNTLEDTEANIIGDLSQAFGRVIAEAEDTAFVAGAGGNRPQGITTDSLIQANYNASGVAAAISDASHNGIDALITLMSATNSSYRMNGTFAMNSVTMGSYMQLKDGNGQYLWNPATANAPNATLLGKRVVAAEGMPDVAAGTYPVAFGDFSFYQIRDRSGVTITRLNERYAEKDMVGFIVKKRVAGLPKLAEAFRLLKIAAS